MNRIAARLEALNTRESITEALDEVEYLFEVIPPELQEPAETLIALLREKLKVVKCPGWWLPVGHKLHTG
ncbi:MAG TPA: hypothetical protein VET88_14130 [Gammaproteobacteria bacterium]|nr:hypothetical protein [Gammaproteobacteria bacterium]